MPPPSPRPVERDDRLPVDAVLTDALSALEEYGSLVLVAPPGAGKTTRVPLELLGSGPVGRIVLLEPRRVAARAAAMRLSGVLGEQLGGTVGLTTRDDRRTSRRTRLEVVTEGVLLRRLQRDPTLPGVDLLVFDEFHERNLEGDLALAFALEARSAFRPDLRLLVMSATLAASRVAELLGGAPVVRAQGRAHPVRVEHRASPAGRDPVAAVAATVVDVLGDTQGDVLVFLPGTADIRRVARDLAARPLPGAPAVLPFHGSLPSHEQDAVLQPRVDGPRAVVLATDLAESSITIPGVRVVVDAGLSREPRFDPATGMTGLVTVPASRASADQRAGRAGRLGPGSCVRLWSEREHAGRDAHPRPAIATDDLTGPALEVVAWGAEVGDLALLDQPPAAAWGHAREVLRDLGALDAQGRVTAHGRDLVALPLHPRLGHLLLRGAVRGQARLATEVAAVLSDRDPFTPGRDAPDADLTARVRWLRGAPAPPGCRPRRGARQRLRRQARRLQDLLAPQVSGVTDGDDPDLAGELVAIGWPERLAAARPERRGGYVLASGRGAELAEADPMAGADLLAVATLDRGASVAHIHLAAPVSRAAVERLFPDRLEHLEEVGWRDDDVVGERSVRLGAIVLERVRMHDVDPASARLAVLSGLERHGLGLLAWRDADRQLQARIGLLFDVLGEPWPDVDDAALHADLASAIGPFLTGVTRRRDLERVRVRDVLLARVPGAVAGSLDALAPTHVALPSGRRVALDYRTAEQPVLAVRIQELFGATTAPSVVSGRVPVLLHLLSPAGRPVQITTDLAGFWTNAYPEVRAELRGRYPRHAWPQDPTRATPTRGTRGR